MMMTVTVLICLAGLSVSAWGNGIYSKDVGGYSENAVDYPYYPGQSVLLHRQSDTNTQPLGGIVTTPIGRLMLLKTVLVSKRFRNFSLLSTVQPCDMDFAL